VLRGDAQTGVEVVAFGEGGESAGDRAVRGELGATEAAHRRERALERAAGDRGGIRVGELESLMVRADLRVLSGAGVLLVRHRITSRVRRST
jgi:hypothetical protein